MTATWPAPLRLAPHTVRLGIGAGGLLVTGLWALSARPDDVAALLPGTLFASAARLTGLLAAYGVVVMLVLMTRIPAVEHGVGADRLARWHAWAGRYVLTLCGAHAVLALLAYATEHDVSLVAAGREFARHPALLAAAAGLVLLLTAGVVSARRMRARMRHETWRAVHLLMYVAAGAAFWHQLAGPDVAGHWAAAWAWSMLHTSVAVLLVWYRLVVPVRQALRHALRVVAVVPEGLEAVSVTMRGKDLAALRAEPGQFLRWRFLTRRLWRTSLPFSLSAPVRGDEVRITVKALGDHTRRMRRLRPGVRVWATGPFGALTAHRRTRRRVLLLAGGVGITPLRALFETLPGKGREITLLYRADEAEDLVLRDELEAIAAERGAGLFYLLGSPDDPYNPLAPEVLRGLVPDLAQRDVYLCGPPGMTEAARSALGRAGVPASRIHSEEFAF
ncbi:ferric reductase-like transmembrane domain-containing protein [Streptomyces xiamenensis]|uniref:ferredoxin reductase family protein n=1 Tax=Streptomyces xiamenensis TaxID=408015 RepID=UPI0036E15255